MSISASLITATDDARVTALDNGLVVIIREDNSAPVVSAQVWCRAGSVDEGRWLGAGLSHVLEHMLFKGTTTRGAGRIDQEVQDAGGYMNAYTSFDRTVYWINVPNTGTRVAVDILCDIVQNATLPEGELVKELDVIRREMDMCHDDPGRRSSRQLFETAYTRSPYRYPVIGIPDIFNLITRSEVLEYYREKYAPNNLFLVVVGDVNAAEVMAQVEGAFAGVKARPVPQVPLLDEPRQTAPRQRIEEASIEMGYLHDSWHIPELRHPDVPALDVLSVILGSGRSSRLFREIREKTGLVHSADAWTYNPGSPGLFGVSAVADGERFEAASRAILEEVRKLSDAAPSEAELAKAIKQITAGTLAVRKTMQGQAQDLGSSWLTVGDLGYSARYLASVEKVTCAEMQRIAQTYLREENRTLCALLPTGFKPKVAVSLETSAKSPVTRLVLPNGLRLLVKEDHRLPFVELRAVFQGGVLTESVENNGVTGLMTKMLIKGAGRRSAEEISSEIESVGGSLDAYAGNNSFGVAAEVLETDLELGLELVSEVLQRPTFPESEMEREREYQLAGIRAQKDQLLQVAARTMRRVMFGQRGYGLDSAGTEESVAGLTLGQVREFHRRLTVPNNGVLAIYGRVDTQALHQAVIRHFGEWSAGRPSLATPLDEISVSGPIRKEEHKDKKQAVVVLGYPGVTMRNPDRHALEVLQEACSDLGSRLFMRIRDELGLAYYVGAQNFIGLEPGFFSFYAGTEPGKVPLVVDELMAEARKLSVEGLTAEELKRSKAKIIGQKKIARQDLGGYAMTTALDELYGLGYAHSDAEDALFEAISLEDVRRVAAAILKPEASVLSIVSPPPAAT
jgi:zinc protease